MKIYRLIVRLEAERDIRDAHSWYEQQLPGLGHEFIRCLDAAISSIGRSPELYPEIHKNVRRILVRRFPYGIFYLINGHDVVILAVFHVRRDPIRLKSRKR